jgi:hypothetical protein
LEVVAIAEPKNDELFPTQFTEDRRSARMKLGGALSHLHEETERIMRIIEEDCEQIDPEEWG